MHDGRMPTSRWSVRRFVALDMHGAAGTLRRRRLILAEFVVGTACLILLGIVLAAHGGGWWGVWLIGCGLGYGALAAQTVTLYPSTRLAAELEGADIAAEIRRYSVAQLLLLVPGLIAAVAVAQARRGWRDRGDAVTTVKGTGAHSDPR